MIDYVLVYDYIDENGNTRENSEESFTGTEYDLHLRIESLTEHGAYNITVEKMEWEG